LHWSRSAASITWSIANEVTVILGLCLSVVVALLVALAVWTWRRRPTAVAQRRLTRQLAECASALLAPAPARRPLDELLHSVRAQWFETELRNTAVDALRAPGIGPTLQEALRAHGIATAADLPRLAAIRVPSLGEKKRFALEQAYASLREGLWSRAEALSWAECDALCAGRLSRLAAEIEQRTREHAREVEGAEIRRAEIERRLRQLRDL
jgi:DNA-binding helix-hairpin-helix protein with protein kinase domain